MQGDLSYPPCATAVQQPAVAPSCIHLSVHPYPFCPSFSLLARWESGCPEAQGTELLANRGCEEKKRRRSTCCFRTLQPPHVSTSFGAPSLAPSRLLLFFARILDFASSIRCSVLHDRHGWPWPWSKLRILPFDRHVNSQGVCHRLLDRVGALRA